MILGISALYAMVVIHHNFQGRIHLELIPVVPIPGSRNYILELSGHLCISNKSHITGHIFNHGLISNMSTLYQSKSILSNGYNSDSIVYT